MKSTNSYLLMVAIVCNSLLFLCSASTYAQGDTVQFKFIPKYYPEDDAEFISMPKAEVAHSPKLHFPTDSVLQGKQADVWVKVKVNRQGSVKDAKVIKSSNDAFNKYALEYARQFKFKWADKWPEEMKGETVWFSIPARFRP